MWFIGLIFTIFGGIALDYTEKIGMAIVWFSLAAYFWVLDLIREAKGK